MKRNIFLMIIVIISSIILTSGISHAITVIASPNPATVGQNVTVNISASFPPFGAPSCVIETNFGDGSPLVSVGTCTTSTCNLSTSHTYILPGIYTITARSLSCTLPPLPPDPARTSITINCAPLTITTTSPLPTATVGQTYTQQLQTTGGQAPINFSLISGLLPPGLSLSSTGLISGTPTSSGNYSFTVRARDSCSAGAQNIQKAFSLTVNPVACAPLSITSSSPLSAGTVGQVYSSQLQTSGGQAPITFSLASGSLLPGLSLSSSGNISGTPTTAGNYSFTVSAADSCSAGAQNIQKAFSLTVNPVACAPLSITSSSPLSAGTVGQVYSSQLQTSGGQAPITFSLASGSLPPGLSLSSSGNISGTPTTAGNYSFTVSAADSCSAGAQNIQKAFSLTVNPVACAPLSITSSSPLSAGTVGQVYSSQLQTSGGQAPITFSLASGSLPPGLSLSSSGNILGTPTTAGNYSFTVNAADSCSAGAQNIQKAFSLTVNPVACAPLSITSSSPLSAGTVGQVYSSQLQTSGGQAPITFSLASGSLPPGLSLNSSGNLLGTPTTAGNYSFTVSAADSCPAGAQNVQGAFSLTVNPVACSPLSITTSSTLSSATVGQAYTQQLQTTGGQAPITFSLASGSLLPGLSLSSSGNISGTPTTAGNYSFTVSATDSCSAGAQNIQGIFSITINPAPCPVLSIASPSTLSTGTVGLGYSYQLHTSGGQAPLTFSVISGSLPPGLNLNITGFISGTPTAAGNYSFTVRATDSCAAGAQSVQETFTLQVQSLPPSPPPPITISVNVVPSSLSIPRGYSSTASVLYQFTGTSSLNTTLTSSAGNFIVGSEIIGTNSILLTVNIRNGSGNISEAINVPVRIIDRALKMGSNRFTYMRTFTSTDINLTASVDFMITTEAGAAFDIKRIELYFENRRAEITVERNYPKLKAYADVRFVGSGLLQGYWEVDGRVLSTVNQHLTFAGSITLQTPEIPPLPTFDPGSHIIRFIITSPVTEIPLPSIIYFVTSAEFEGKRFSIKLISPEDDSVLEYLPIKFGWEKLNTTTLFLIRFFDNPSSKPIFSAYAKDASYALPEIVFKKIFSPGQKYYWKVEGFDSGNNIIGESGTWSFSFRKR